MGIGAFAVGDTIEIDLATALKHISDSRDGLFSNRLRGCVAQVRISAEVFAALLAGKFGAIDSIVGPSELFATPLAIE